VYKNEMKNFNKILQLRKAVFQHRLIFQDFDLKIIFDPPFKKIY